MTTVSAYPIAPTPTSTKTDLLQSWLDNQLSDADDTVFVTKEGNDLYKIDVNGEVEYANGEELKKLKFDLKGGNDTLVVGEGVPIDITAELGEGDDRFWGGGGNDNVNGGKGNDRIYGRGGDDHMNGGAGNDEIWGLMGHNTMIGGAGSDVFMTGTGSQNLVDFTGSEDSHPTAAPNSTTTATPRSQTTAPSAGTTPPATAAPGSPTAGASPVGGNGNIVINGDNNTIYTGSSPTGAPGTSATSPISGSTGTNNFNLVTAMALGGKGFTQSGPGTYTVTMNGVTCTVSQPGGAGTSISMKYSFSSGTLKGTTMSIELKSDGSHSTSFSGGNLTSEQQQSLNQIANEGIEMLMELITGKPKKKGSGSGGSSAGGSSAGGASAAGGDGGTGGIDAGGSIDSSGGASGVDGASGLDTGGGDMSDSWFLVLAIGMGTIMNKLAEKLIDLLNQIKSAGDNPPFQLTAEFQAKSQQLAFMQQAFMNALNSLGESIKTGVQAGGASR